MRHTGAGDGIFAPGVVVSVASSPREIVRARRGRRKTTSEVSVKCVSCDRSAARNEAQTSRRVTPPLVFSLSFGDEREDDDDDDGRHR